jgi:hypothetical protein
MAAAAVIRPATLTARVLLVVPAGAARQLAGRPDLTPANAPRPSETSAARARPSWTLAFLKV